MMPRINELEMFNLQYSLPWRSARDMFREPDLPVPIVTMNHDGSNVMIRSDQACPLTQVVKVGANCDFCAFNTGGLDPIM